MIYCVALTGNIATGKSTVAHLFKEKGVTVLSADIIARELTSPSEPAWQAIVNYFGPTILLSSQQLNRTRLRNIIFKAPEKRIWLENLLHPMIREDILKKLELAAFQKDIRNDAYCLIEIPLLSNRTDYPYLNRVLLTVASTEKKMQRLMERDQHSETEALAILATQPTETCQRTFADDILTNNSDHKTLAEEVSKLHEKYLKLSKRFKDKCAAPHE